jgi:predicted nucleic acid-binding protein
MFLDTTVLVDILRGDQKIKDYIEKIAKKEQLLFSIVSIGELSDWSYSNKLDPNSVVSNVKSAAIAINISEKMCLDGSKFKQIQRKAGKVKFSLIDGLIAACAMNIDETLLTRDRNFEGLENVIIL